MADGGARECGRGCYGMGTSKTKEGKRSGAHVDPVEVDGELEGVFGAANRTAAIAGRGDEDGGDGVASGHPASRASW